MIRLLIADDHAVMREGLRTLVQATHSIDVVAETDNGVDAVTLTAALQPDVVLMDISMPGHDGIEATRRIARGGQAARVLMLSMHTTAQHVFRARAAGAAGYLLKECPGSEVIEAVRAVHAGRPWFSAALGEDAERLTRASPLSSLTPREREVLRLVVEGYSSAEIGQKPRISRKTVETYRARIAEKLGIHSVPALVKFALQEGLISADSRAVHPLPRS